ncbi:hypothetical protein AJ79_02269 [Helicocarpus griseus UAMH5409]|uniref:RING-type domain-containing protein n=1 Tax=Helicocarpus griseus UAMH5409 TaxID=1447875 RepID=A0A2B7Y398_9EURO|nr:hypothetical protein AJ79_02269 [Helicocarpus griseus UAMH5409]
MEFQELSDTLRGFLMCRLNRPLVEGRVAPCQAGEIFEVIGVLNRIEPLTCIARRSDGGRCKCRISREKRQAARELLEIANQDFFGLRDQNSHVAKFRDVARHLLCQRSHQKLALGFAALWSSRVALYQHLELTMRFRGLRDEERISQDQDMPSFLEAMNQQSIQIRLMNEQLLPHNEDDVPLEELEMDDEPAPNELSSALFHPPETRFVAGLAETFLIPGGKEKGIFPPRMTIEGDCPICHEPLVNEELKGSPYDSPEICWCTKSCGRNFHKECARAAALCDWVTSQFIKVHPPLNQTLDDIQSPMQFVQANIIV